MASKTNIQASSLLADLKGAKGAVAWQVGKIVNALLAKALEEEPDNVVLQAIDALTPGPNDKYIAGMQADDVRAVVGQIVAATDGAPAIAEVAHGQDQGQRHGPLHLPRRGARLPHRQGGPQARQRV